MADELREPAPAPRPARRALRPWLRALHRDAGYLAVGLTVVYALSGLAVNHIAEWDPNFRATREVHELGPLAGTPRAVTAAVQARLDLAGAPREIYAPAPDQIDVTLDRAALHIDPQRGHVVVDRQRPRFFLRVANWLHLNRGKRAWTFVADAYALGLLLLAVSGLFMLSGRRGLLGRGGVLVALGVAVPVAYVVLSGGP